MKPIRVGAAVALMLLALYYVLRSAAQQCAGAQCDGYIYPSLLLPAAILLAVAYTGRAAIYEARKDRSGWYAPLIAVTVAGVFGTVAAVMIFRDRPDFAVPVATVLLLLTPLAALVYSFRRSPLPLP